MGKKEVRRSVITALAPVLSKFDGNSRSCGTKVESLADDVFDKNTGTWTADSGLSSKPLRVIVQIEQADNGELTPTLLNHRLGFINTANSPVLIAYFRVIPAIKLWGRQNFLLIEDYEWLLFVCVAEGFAQGHSSETVNLDLATGAMTFKGQPVPYTSAGLVGLVDPSDDFQVPKEGAVFLPERPLTYEMATEAIQRLIHVEPVIPVQKSDEGDE